MKLSSTPRTLCGGAVATILVAAFALQSAGPAEAAATADRPGGGQYCPGGTKSDGSCRTLKEFGKKCRQKGGRVVIRRGSTGSETWHCEIDIHRIQGPNTQPESVGPHQVASR